MKKIVSFVLAAILAIGSCFALASCGAVKDVETIKKNGKIVIGVTDYAPFDYENATGSGEWVGFDADMARLVAAELGVTCEFVEIDWDNKITELKSKKIDLIWNGMTMTDDLAKSMDFSYAYAENYQVAVVKKANAQTLTSIAAMQGKKVVCESGSAGESAAKENFAAADVTDVAGQTKALMEVNSNTADVAIVDYSLAKSLCGNGSYADLMIVDGVAIGQEQFAVGARKNSDLVDVVNSVLVKAFKEGTAERLRSVYGANDDGSNSIALVDLSAK